MARLARVVVPGIAHHVTQRGNGRACTFFSDVEVWAWCLMPNHVHLVLVPSDSDGLRRALAAAHRRYAGVIHARRRRTGNPVPGRM
jgi:putative transposase